MAQVSIRFAAPGTRNYTVGNDVVGGVMRMEAIGAGGAGGTATVNSGGGGKGGAYARRNAQAVTSGQTLTVTVAPSVAAAAGTASTVATGGGSTASVDQKSFTVTGGSPTGSLGFGSTSVIRSSGAAITFISGSSGSDSLTIPATTQSGDLILVSVVGGTQTTPSGYTQLFAAQPAQGGLVYALYYKIAQAGDGGTTFSNGGVRYVCTVYRNALAPSFVASQGNQPNQGPITCSGVTDVTGAFAIYFCSTGGVVGTNSTINPPTGVTKRQELASPDSVSMHDAPLTAQAGTTILSAAGGNVGGNGSATAGGTGATAQNGTSVGDVTFTGGNGANGTLTAGGRGGGGAGDASNTTGPGPNTQFGVSGGTGGLSAAAGQVYGGGGGGATTLAARGAGASGIVVLTYSTGTGTISHTARFNRRITAFRRVVASITHSAVFDRLVTIRRMFTASVTHVSRALKTIKLRKTASVAHLAAYTRKALRLRKTASIVHTPFIRRALRVLRTASIVHTPVFKRLVTLRRRFVASIQHRARMLVKLEARLIPREGGGGTVTNVFRNLFLFDD